MCPSYEENKNEMLGKIKIIEMGFMSNSISMENFRTILKKFDDLLDMLCTRIKDDRKKINQNQRKYLNSGYKRSSFKNKSHQT